jgi:hypothetical protein
MEDRIETTPETRKEWIAPELKKIDIEQITAAGTNVFGDGPGFS